MWTVKPISFQQVDVFTMSLQREPRGRGGIRALLRKCLRKDRAMRLQSAGDVRIEIQEALKTAQPIRVLREFFRKDFNRNFTFQLQVSGAVYLALAAFAKQCRDFVGAEVECQSLKP
jgi:hypothetical protein